MYLEDTRENIIESMNYNILERNQQIKDFIEALDLCKNSIIIAIDGTWGCGKTFFVKQVCEILNGLRRKQENCDCKEEKKSSENVEENLALDSQVDKLLESEKEFNSIKIENNYRTVYYNAWLYDDHSDPLESIFYSIIQSCRDIVGSGAKRGISSKTDIFFELFNLYKNIDFTGLRDKIQGKNLIESVESTEELKQRLNYIFQTLLDETADRLVVFIDEIDRCRPDYAIKTLEK